MPRRRPTRASGSSSIVIDDFGGHPLMFDMARALSDAGHEVTFHYYPDDPGPKGAQAGLGPTVTAVPLPGRFSKYSVLRRIRDELRYGWRSSRKMPPCDVVVVTNMPVLAGLVELVFARVRRQRFVVWWQDRQGGLARASGGGELVARGLELAERMLLSLADGVIAISPGFAAEAGRLRRGRQRVLLQPNWGTLGRIEVGERENRWRGALGLGDAFVFLYTGTLARKHDPRLLLAIADAFDETDDVRVVACCSGEGADQLRAVAADHPNLVLLPLAEADEYPSALAAADVLVALLEKDASAHSVPSKVLTYLCAGRPILIAAPADNLAAVTVSDAEAGWVVSPDPEAVANIAAQVRAEPTARVAAGRRARRYAEEHFDVTAIAATMAEFLESGLRRH